MSRQGKPVTVPAGEYSTSFFLGSHTIVLHGKADSPATLEGKPVDVTLSPDDVRHILSWIALHPDEYGPALRAIVAEWGEQDQDALDREAHTTWTMSTIRRDRLTRAARTETGHEDHADR
jgi:hypothetical protein